MTPKVSRFVTLPVEILLDWLPRQLELERPGRWSGLVALTLAGFGGWYLTNLGGALYIDEVFYARTGWGLLTGNPYENPTHAVAPMAKYLIGVGQLVFGRTSFGVRLPVALLGVGTLFVTYRLGALLGDRRTGYLSMLLLGSTFAFATEAVRGMLDVPLAFCFVSTVYLAARWVRDDWRPAAPLFGVAAVATVTTKVYGFVYLLGPLAVVLGAHAVWKRRSRAGPEVQAALVPAAGAAIVLFLPYFFVPHPPLTEAYGPGWLMGFARSLLEIPILGNFVYVFGAAFVQNVIHIGNGHAVTVGTTVYQYPPVWSYGYWLLERGGVYVVFGALLVGGATYDALVARRLDAATVGFAAAVPFVVLSLLTVKFPRYILPLFPLLAAGGVYYTDRFVRRGVRHLSEPFRAQAFDVGSALVVLVLLGGVLIPPSAVAPSVTEPIQADSGYDEAAAFVTEYAADRPDQEILVLSYHNVTFGYYFEARDNVVAVGLGTAQMRTDDEYRQRIESMLCRGEVDLVVDLRHNERLETQFVGQFVRNSSEVVFETTRSPGDQTLVVYEMANKSTAGSADAAEPCAQSAGVD